MMNRRTFLCGLTLGTLAAPLDRALRSGVGLGGLATATHQPLLATSESAEDRLGERARVGK
jgi:hypothetical protein